MNEVVRKDGFLRKASRTLTSPIFALVLAPKATVLIHRCRETEDMSVDI